MKKRCLRYEFEVARYWKGNAGPIVSIDADEHSSSCGYEFNPGDSYVVFARAASAPTGSFTTSLCTGTTELAHASALLAVLGPGVPPIPRIKARHNVLFLIPAVWIAAGIVGYRFWRKRRRPTAVP
jgi:hypothetical protein